MHLHEWRQFADVQLRFHDRLTVLTGANGAGKTTILNILSQHFGWALSFSSQPRITRKGALRYYSGAGGAFDEDQPGPQRVIGELAYSDGSTSEILVPSEVDANYDVVISARQQLTGIYLPSHRPAYTYSPVTEIPTQVIAADQLFDQYLENLRSYWSPRSRTESPSFRLKRSLISLATFGYGNQVVEPNAAARETFEGFQRILALLLPQQIGFKRLSIRTPEVVLETTSGDFSLDAASGGVASLTDLAWQMYMRSVTSEANRFVVIADELENHLHPALQREVMPRLLEAFPHAQFIVATHNPFVVNSVRDSFVYALRFVDQRVIADQLDLEDKAGTADDTLREVLGVPVPLPLWVEQAVEEVVRSMDPSEVSSTTLRTLRARLNDVGAGRQFSLVLDQLLENHAATDED